MFGKKYSNCLFLILVLIGIGCHRNQKAAFDAPAYHNPLVAPLTAAIMQNPDSAELYYQRSEALDQVHSPDLAQMDLEKAVSLDPSNLKYLYALGEINVRLQKANEAIAVLNKLIEKAPHSGPGILLLSQAYLLKQQPDKAMQEINIILSSDSTYPGALYALAKVQLVQKDTQKAIRTLQKALSLRDDDYSASLLLANTFADKHNTNAILQYRKTFDIDTSDVSPLVALGQFYEKEKKVKAAKSTYYECLLKDPDCTAALLNMGVIFMQEDSVNKALRQFQTAIKTQPNSADAYYQAGLCFERLHQKDSARSYFSQALVFAPSDKTIMAAWKRNTVRSKS